MGSVHRLEPHPELRIVVLVPSVRLDTASARGALPDRVAMADAVFNLGHAALLVEALTNDPSLLLTTPTVSDPGWWAVPTLREIDRRRRSRPVSPVHFRNGQRNRTVS